MRPCLVLLVLLLLGIEGIAQRITLPLSVDQRVASGFSYRPDPAGALQAASVRDSSVAGLFQAVDTGSWKKDIKVYWLRFTAANESGSDNEWLFDFENWSEVNFYYPQGDRYSVKTTGHLVPFNQRDYPVANKNYIRLDLPKGAAQTCFVRLESRFNNEKIPQDLSFKVSLRSLRDREDGQIGRVIYAFMGIFTVMFLYNLFIFLATRLKSYAWYLLVLFFALYHTAYNSGYLISTFGDIDAFPVWLRAFERVSSPLFGISILLFIREFLKTRERYPVWHKTLNVFLVLNALAGLLCLVNYELGTMVSGLAGFVLFPVILTLGIINVRRKYPSAQYFLLGYTAFLLGIMGAIMTVMGVLPANNFNNYFALPLGTTLEIVLFSFALANLINVLRRENEEKQTRIIAQLEENQALQTKVNRELEQKVQERTAEINAQKEQISEQKAAIELEKEKADRLLLNILPEATAQELKEKGFATPKQYQDVTVLFTDFVAFTEISERLGPDQLVAELDYCFHAFDEIIERYGLEKIKTIGDAYMAAAGVPRPDENGALNTVKAALEIEQFMEDWSARQKAKGDRPWQLRVGIHTGPVTAGVVGKKKFAFDIWGDTVNIASIMESRGVPGKVNISETTYEIVKASFPCTHRGKIEGKHHKQLDMYLLGGEKRVSHRT